MCVLSPNPTDEQDLLTGQSPAANKIAIMQPYFLPYLGYFQLIKAVNTFVVYDNIKYTKKGWINRNRILLNGKDTLFTIPLANSSDFLPINQKFIAVDYANKKEHILAKIQQAYRKAPYFNAVFPCLEAIFNFESHNLFEFIFFSIQMVVNHLHINTPLVVSSTLPVDQETKGNKKVLAICESLEATAYINPIGGIGLYTGKEFKEHGIHLYFHNMDVVPYRQAGNDFISHLSIIDVLMYNSPERVNEMLDQYKLLEPADIVITGGLFK